MTEFHALLQPALAGLLPIALLALLGWLLSLLLRDAGVADICWPACIGGATLAYGSQLPDAGARGLVLTALVLTWALRLGIHIARRAHGQPEDRRYQALRERHQPHFGLKSLWLVFGLQGLLAWVVSAPLLAALAGTRPPGWLDAAGAALAIFGLGFEALADAQLARFRAGTGAQGRIMDRGLWRYSRHPNYFGEACVWWGLWLMALAAGGGAAAWSVVSPLLVTVLLLRISGVPLLEADLARRRPGYRAYMERTRSFIPGPPRKDSA